jgi:tryptophanase
MRTENIFIAHPITLDQINALKAVVKAFDVKFEIKKTTTIDNAELIAVRNSIKKGFEEMKQIKKYKLKTTSLTDFLNEL